MLILLLIIDDNNEDPMESFLKKQYGDMLYIAKSNLGIHQAEDAVQDVIVKLLVKYEGKYDELIEMPRAFFATVIRNHTINLSNKKQLPTTSDFDGEDNVFVDYSGLPEDMLIETDAKEALVKLIRQLTPKYRSVVELKLINFYTNKEIADILRVSESTVSTRFHRAREMLKDILTKEGYTL